MTTTATKTHFVKARVDPALVERFALAAQLDGRTVADALRSAMSEYVARVAAKPHNDDDPQPVQDLRAVPTPTGRAPNAGTG